MGAGRRWGATRGDGVGVGCGGVGGGGESAGHKVMSWAGWGGKGMVWRVVVVVVREAVGWEGLAGVKCGSWWGAGMG